jgi:disulfide bond formation protein DsbB
MAMTQLIKSALSNRNLAFFIFASLSATALAAAFVSQYAYGLQPCVLCVYQRIPYGIVIALGILGLWFNRHPSGRAAPVFMGLIALTFLADAVIAFYHTGVERHWWKSFLEGCAVPNIEGNITDVLAQIEATPPVRCDQIPWTDPVIGLSMANYNVIVCLVLAAVALYATTLSRRTPA